ncbi:MAG: hypothetical protein KatS3mg031_1219 [Chitinophagales bacterium]|nr:MAG: hypothetical protein KatS3mg031_1219 [Chitinophagales bacterium]
MPVRFFCAATVFLLTVTAQYLLAQGTQVPFGQNRVQYKKFEWSYYETDRVTTYFYLGGQDIGKFVMQFAGQELSRMENILETKLNKRVIILVYNDLSDLNQTNIGQNLDVVDLAGTTKIIDNKIFVYFDGNHQHLERQIRHGLAQIYINHILLGGYLQEVIQNSFLLNLPEWFTQGLASYLGENWSTELDNRLRDGILTGKYKKFSKLTGEDARFVGHALLHYVEEKYGRAAIPNLLYYSRQHRSIETGFLFVLGGSVRTVTQEWYRYCYDVFSEEKENRELPTDTNWIRLKRFRKQRHYEPKLSSDGRHLAFATNNRGLYRVRLLNYTTGKEKAVLRAGMKTTTLVTDFAYPLLAWSPDGKTLAVIFEKKDRLYLLLYNTETHQKIKQPITKFQQIHHFAFTDDPRVLVMAASNRGQSDLYTYVIPSTTVEQLTNDFYDDLHAGFIKLGDKRGILFVSNRTDTELKVQKLDSILPPNHYDLFFYDLLNRSGSLTRVTHTPLAIESEPVQLNDSLFAFLSDANGIMNRYAGYFKSVFAGYDTVYYFRDSVVTRPRWILPELPEEARENLDSLAIVPAYKDTALTFPISNFFTGILEHDLQPAAGKSLDMHLMASRYEFFLNEIPPSPSVVRLSPSYYQNFLTLQRKYAGKRSENGSQNNTQPESTELEDSTDYFFQTPFTVAPHLHVDDYTDFAEAEAGFAFHRLSRAKPYQIKLSTDYVQGNFLDNTILITRYQKYNPNGSLGYNFPALGPTISFGASELFEDHLIGGGFHFPYDFKGSEYFIVYDNLRKRLDKRFLYYRKVDTQTSFSVLGDREAQTRLKTNLAEVRLSYPFDVIKSVRATLGFRHENLIYSAVDDITLHLPNEKESWLYLRLEYVHDNTVGLGLLNLREGLRFRIYGELHKEVLFNERTVGRVNLTLPGFNNAYLIVLGADVRYYLKVHKNIIWANRLAWGSSLGNRRMLFYLGNVDGQLYTYFPSDANGDTLPPYNAKANRPGGGQYAFQSAATNIRGFDQNIRNGNSYVLFNTELRIPIFSYFSSTIKSEFLKHFQLVAFMDAGTAWEGVDPWKTDTPISSEDFGRDPVTVRVNYFKNPIVFSYGLGCRFTPLFKLFGLLGYYWRIDFAWGNDSGVTSMRPVIHFASGFDF